MRKFFTLLIAVFLLGISFQTNAQNLIENWDGNGATGVGSEPGTFGWVGTPTVTWGVANVSGIRFIDNPASYTYYGTAWTGRGLFVRWDGTGGSSVNTVFSYPVTLDATKSYLFTGKIGWNSNASGTSHQVISINSAADNSGTFLDSDTITITAANRLKFYGDSMVFSPPTSGTYYLTVKCDIGILGIISDLSIVEVTDACLKEITNQTNSLAIANATKITSNITLPTGTGNVSITWRSSNPAVVTNAGVITQPAKFSAQATLYANLTATCGGYKYSIYKNLNVIVQGVTPSPTELLAEWKFDNLDYIGDTAAVKDVSGNNLVGKLKNEASIRSIGTTTKFKVLDLGNNKGYFDMGTELGAAMYTLSNYTICAYFRVDTTYKELANAGNFLWTFSNSQDQSTGAGNGYLAGRLNITQEEISTNNGSTGNQSVKLGTAAAQGGWHHMAYIQKADSGKIYIDGAQVAKGRITNLPQTALTKAGLFGTPFNWIGRSCFAADAYLRKTLVYDFQLFNIAMSEGDLVQSFDVSGVITSLNKAYNQKSAPDTLLALKTELANLSLGNLTAVSSNLTLPTRGTLDNTVIITWTTSQPAVITSTGVITRRDYINTPAVLTAILTLGGQKVSKTFPLYVAPNPGTPFASDLILNYSFDNSLVSGTTVTDAAEKHFTGTLKKGAAALTMGPADNKQNVLKLYSDSAYFDMGANCGQLIYGLADYTVSVYFLADKSKTNFAANGNFIYTFSNSDSAGTVRNGYMFGRASVAIHCVSSSYYATGNMATANATAPSLGMFHHFVYTQNGLVGTAYVDGKVVSTVSNFSNLPLTAIAKEGKTGTNFNFLGRSNYVGDVYLKNALLADFRLYKKALSVSDIDTMQKKALKLNLAFINDSVPTLLSENNNLDLGDLTKVVADIILPGTGVFDNTVLISWKSSNPSIIGTSGIVTRPNFMNTNVVLTATLTKNGQTLTKQFTATVLANPGTTYASDLLLNYNFESRFVTGTAVTDSCEKHFTGTLMNGAAVESIGVANNKFNVLKLAATDTAYFDMGVDCGQLMYVLQDYSVSTYFLVETTKNNFSKSGNIIYSFANSDNSATDKNGYLFGRATNIVHGITSQYAGAGLMQTTGASAQTTQGKFHHMVYTQSGAVGTTYLDGAVVSSVTTFSNLPNNTLAKEGKTGTQFNWLGKSSNKGDAYLGNAMLADFKLYKKALSASEIAAMQAKRINLDNAYNSLPGTSVVILRETNQVLVDNSIPGLIQIIGLTGKEKVSVYDLLGRNVAVGDVRAIYVKPGIYIVKVDNGVAKVLVN